MPRRIARALAATAIVLATSTPAFAADVRINGDQPVFADAVPFTITGTSDQPQVTLELEGVRQTVDVIGGTWTATFDAPKRTGTYTLTATAGGATATQLVRVQLGDNVVRQSPFASEIRYATPQLPEDPNAYETMTDRWRIVPPPYELDEKSRGRLDPYNRNRWKGDEPFFKSRPDWFLVLTGISDTLVESRTLPTPSGVSTEKPGAIHFFGSHDQSFLAENFIVSADMFQGDTAFKPVAQRVKATIVANATDLRVDEDAIVKPDVRRGTERRDGRVSLQELFYERKLRDLSVNYDVVSVRAGIQPFASDFRGFIFNDTNLGARLFGNYASNRIQFNLAVFDRLEKDTNSGLNLLERRDQQVGIANIYIQDFLRRGFTETFSVHYLRDGASTKYDRNGILVRPAPVGVFEPHDIDAVYLGTAGLGHLGRFNFDHALYYVFGHDSENAIAGPDPTLHGRKSVSISAGMAALEVSYDHDWFRPRLGFFYATGDRNPRDRTARGFDAIFESPNFAGGGFSFYNRMGIRLTGTGVSLIERGSLLPDLRTSKDEGQPNFVNPGVQLATAGVDIDVTPRLKAIVTANYIRLDSTKSIEAILFQGDIHPTLGEDISLGLRYRPFLNQNVILTGGTAAFIPGQGFKDIYESQGTMYHLFMNVLLQF